MSWFLPLEVHEKQGSSEIRVVDSNKHKTKRKVKQRAFKLESETKEIRKKLPTLVHQI